MFELEISLAGAGLPIGVSRSRLECPACKGGGTREKSLNITRLTHTLAWKCHRASCGAAGYVPTSETAEQYAHSGATHSPRARTKEEFRTEPLPQEKEVLLETQYGIPKEILTHFRVRFHPDTDSIAYPVYSDSVYLSEVGYQLRDQRKSISAVPFSTDFARAGFYSLRSQGRVLDTIIFVEDPNSALKVCQLYDTFCLFGTHLNYEKVCSVVNEGYTRALLHLDWDARAKSLKYQREYSMFFKWLYPVFSFKDPKDMPLGELKELYGAVVAGSGHQEPQSVG